MSKTWTIGSGSGCDLEVAAPASARHCRLTIGLGGAVLEDLGSTAGTYVNRVRITGEVLVSRADAITIGPSVPMPWPAEPGPFAPAVLRVGREPENDFVVNLPTVSGRHARVTWSGKPGEAEIEDLGSANGTAIGSPDRKITRAPLTPRDTVYLGTSPVSGSALFAKFDPTFDRVLTPGPVEMTIGRAPECQRVIDLPTVSGRHARLSRPGGRATIEDLGSANGTFVNGRRIEAPTPLEPGDLVALGLHQMRFVQPSPPAPAPGRVARTVAEPIPSPVLSPPSIATPIEAAGPGTPASGPPTAVRLAVLLVQAPVLAILIVGVFGGRAGGGGVPAVLSCLGLAATWIGLSNAAIGNVLATPSTPRKGTSPEPADSLPARLGWLGLACVVESVVLWAIVAGLGGLRGSWPLAIALLILTSGVGAALGLLIGAASTKREWRWIAPPAVLLLLWLFGGGPGALGGVAPWSRGLSAASPARWAFEGLLLLESDRVEPITAAEVTDPATDPAERFFPAETERMGPAADAMALVSMLVGLSASAAFVSRASSGAGPSPRPGT